MYDQINYGANICHISLLFRCVWLQGTTSQIPLGGGGDIVCYIFTKYFWLINIAIDVGLFFSPSPRMKFHLSPVPLGSWCGSGWTSGLSNSGPSFSPALLTALQLAIFISRYLRKYLCSVCISCVFKLVVLPSPEFLTSYSIASLQSNLEAFDRDV